MPLWLPGETMLNLGEHIVADAADVAAEKVLHGDGVHDDLARRKLLFPLFGSRAGDERDAVEERVQMIGRAAGGSFGKDDQRALGVGQEFDRDVDGLPINAFAIDAETA